ncbi:MAG: SDR family NAD(P)-dependent oxidoreductase [Planctomycetes bacterium]|nr:SDR family NAD(P)-dependent oxidoreductase [Planctomycetota bacterium]
MTASVSGAGATVAAPPRRTLILGATSAIAAEVAALCAARGDRLWLVGRDADKLRALVQSLGPAVVGHARVDFTDFDAATACVRQAIDGLGGLDRALVAHGWLPDQARTEHDFAYARAVVDANFTSVINLLQPLAAHCAAQRSGHLAVITSVAGERGRPRNYTYGAAKRGLGCYLEGLRSSLYGRGVRVHDIKLGPVPTPMSEGHPRNFLWGEKRAVARGIVAAMERRRFAVWLPRRWRLVMAIVRVLPEFVFQRFGFLAGR